MDNKLFLSIYNYGQKNKGIYNLSIKIKNASAVFFEIAYIILLLYVFLYVRNRFYKAMLIPFFCLITNYALRLLIKRKRPYLKNKIALTFTQKEKYSFPSNHSCCAMIISITYLYFIKPIGVVLILCALLTGFSRIVAGIHYPLDIAAGFSIAVMFALFYTIII